LADGIMRGIMMGACVVSSSAGTICALLWKEAMCARRNTPAAAASLSPSNTVSGTLQIMAKQVKRLDSSPMATGGRPAGLEQRLCARSKRCAAEGQAGRSRALGGRGCAARHGRPIEAAVEASRRRKPAARCR